MKRFTSFLAATSVAATLATATLVPANAAVLTPQQVAGATPVSQVGDLQVTDAVAGQAWFKKFGNDPRAQAAGHLASHERPRHPARRHPGG